MKLQNKQDGAGWLAELREKPEKKIPSENSQTKNEKTRQATDRCPVFPFVLSRICFGRSFTRYTKIAERSVHIRILHSSLLSYATEIRLSCSIL